MPAARRVRARAHGRAASGRIGMTYPLLRQGDLLPAVGVLQKLLNRGGAGLDPDGDYGRRTKAAVETFQRPRRPLVVDGVVGEQTWRRLTVGVDLPVVDCIDIFDPDLVRLEARDIRLAGGTPILMPGMSNGVEVAVEEIRRSARNVFLLRFHGHGDPGVVGVSDGHGVGSGHRTAIEPSNIAALRPILARLRGVFGPYGCIQFMHCQTGRGPDGRRILGDIANTIGVPVTAAVRDQLGGGLRTFRFEGPTFTAIPGGGSLASWCRARPDFAMMSVA
jgi:hypothetical protein